MIFTKKILRKNIFLFCLLSYYWAVAIFLTNIKYFNYLQQFIYFAYITLVFAFEVGLVYGSYLLVKRYQRFLKLPLWLLAILLTRNLFSLELYFQSAVGSLDSLNKNLLFVGLSVIFYALFSFVSSVKIKPIPAIIILVLMVSSAGFKLKAPENLDSDPRRPLDTGALPERLQVPEFKSKPNVYFLIFDAMIPETIAKKFLQIDGLPYTDILKNEQFSFVKNSFTPYGRTVETLNYILAIDEEYYNKGEHALLKSGFINRAVESPLYHAFSQNGYKIQLLSPRKWFGDAGQSHLDFYGYFSDSDICEHAPTKAALLGYCNDGFVGWRAGINKLTGTQRYTSKYPEYFYERISDTSMQKEKWLTLMYVHYPGHVNLTAYRYYKKDQVEGYKRQFLSGAKIAAASLEQLIGIIKKNDPNAVVMVFSDHGAGLTSGIDIQEIPTDSPFDKNDLFRDSKAVLLGVYPKNFCNEEIHGPYDVGRLGRSVIKCLSGKDPLPADYQKNDDHLLPYLYE